MKKMNRIISVMIAILMLVNLSAFAQLSVIASEETNGTAITSFSQIIDLTGEYYLSADITDNTTTISGIFSGTLNGNGKTITTSVPLFTMLSGFVSNLTIEGTINYTNISSSVGALAIEAAEAYVGDVNNNATISSLSTSYYYTVESTNYRVGTGGLVGIVTGNAVFANCTNSGAVKGEIVGGIVGITSGSSTAEVSFINCTNSGEISDNGINHTKVSALEMIGNEYCAVGGILALSFEYKNVSFEGCSNNATVTSTSSEQYVKAEILTGDYYNGADADIGSPTGGIFGFASYTKDGTDIGMMISFDSCENTAVISGGGQVGGIAGWVGYCDMYASDCINNAAVKNSNITAYCGGLFGRSAEGDTSVIRNCTNDSGGIITNGTNGQTGGGIIGFIGASEHYLDTCINNANFSTRVYGNVGGIAGRCADVSKMLYANNCLNNGNIKTSMRAGGLFAIPPILYVTNSTNMGDVTGNSKNTGGFVGLAEWKNTSSVGEYVFINCSNYGNISSGTSVGGIIGNVSGAYIYIYNCSNLGKITSTNSNSDGGGLVGLTNSNIWVYNSKNISAISVKRKAGGIIGSIDVSAAASSLDDYAFVVDNCINSGTVKSTANIAAGIIGYLNYGNLNLANNWLVSNNCVNKGEITGGSAGQGASGFAGYIEKGKVEVNSFMSLGKLTASVGNTYAFGYCNDSDSGYITFDNVKNCYYSTETLATYIYYGNKAGINTDVSTDIAFTTAEPADIESGKLTFDANTSAGSTVFYQTLGSDTTPTPLATSKAVSLDGENYVNTLKKVSYTGENYITTYVDITAGTAFSLPINETVLVLDGGIYKLGTAPVMCWKTGDTLTGAGVNYTADTDTDFSATNIDVNTMEGAAIKLESISKLRFKTTLNKDVYDWAVTTYGASSVSMGTVITPATNLTDLGAFTMSDLADPNKYINVTTTDFYRINDTTATITGVIDQISAENLTLEYAGIGYVCINGIYYYSDTYSVRSVDSVARAALTDFMPSKMTGYTNVTSYGTFKNVYSPYSTVQRDIIGTFVSDN